MWRVRVSIDDGEKVAACTATFPLLVADDFVSAVRPVTSGSIVGARAHQVLNISYDVPFPDPLTRAVYLYALGDGTYAHVYGFVASAYLSEIMYREDMDETLRDSFDQLGAAVWGSAEILAYASDESFS